MSYWYSFELKKYSNKIKVEKMEKEIIKEKLRCVFIILTILLVGVITFFSLRGCDNEKRRLKSAINYIYEVTDIEIPEDCKLVFRYSDNSFHSGMHEGYYVFEFAEEPTDWVKENFYNPTGEKAHLGRFWDYFTRGYFREYFEENKTERITEEFVPNFDTEYLSINKWKIYFFYFPDTMRLMVYVPWI